MTAIHHNPFDNLMMQLEKMPLWVKQVLYVNLRSDLEGTLAKTTLEGLGNDNLLQLWVPELSRDGKQQLSMDKPVVHQRMLSVLRQIEQQRNIMHLAVSHQWSLEQCCLVLLEALDQQLIIVPKSSVVMGTIEYLAGRTRLGEYLVRINRLTQEQLEQALHTQTAISAAMGEKSGIANILINLGYIKKEASDAVLFLKEESRKTVDWSGWQNPVS